MSWPASPAPASSAVSPSARPEPRPLAASHSSARPAARSACSSSGCPSSGQQCGPGGAEERSSPSNFHLFSFRFHRNDCFGPTQIPVHEWPVAHLPVLLQVSDLLPQLFESGHSLGLPQLHPDQLLLEPRHIGVIRERRVPLRKGCNKLECSIRCTATTLRFTLYIYKEQTWKFSKM